MVVSATLAAGCGSSSTGSTTQASTAGAQTIPAPPPTGVSADPAVVSVIRGWSDALRRGDVTRAARYFALPSKFINGPDSNGAVPVIPIRTLGEAEAVNATLPCGARFISADQRGRYVNALFRLTDRPGLGGGCGAGVGQTARTNFVIAHGRIVEWIRAPADPGDNGGGQAPQGPAAPSNPQGGNPTI